MRILCVCEGGRVRSVAMRKVLTDVYGQDALACGIAKNSEFTLKFLVKWSQLILVPSHEIKDGLNTIIRPEKPLRLLVVHIGEDVWHTESNPDLRQLVQSRLKPIMETIINDPNYRP